jgi:hypothetical protein
MCILYVCMYVYMSIYCMYVISICIYVCLCICIYVCVCIYVSMYMYMYMCMHVYVYCVCFNWLKGHHGAVYAVKFSPCGKFLATGSFDKTARIWDVASTQSEVVIYVFTHSYIYSFFSYSFFSHSFIYSCTYSHIFFINSVIHFFCHSFTYLSVCLSFSHIFIHLFIHNGLFILYRYIACVNTLWTFRISLGLRTPWNCWRVAMIRLVNYGIWNKVD